MPHKLFLRPETDQANGIALFQWGIYDVTGQKIKTGNHADLDVIAQTLMQNGIDALEIIALWSASQTFSGYVSLPGGQSRYLQQALPFAVEDQLAQDIESVHIAIGDKGKNGKFPVHVVDDTAFSSFIAELEAFAADEYAIKGVYLDVELLPLGENDLVCWVDQLGFMAHNQHHTSLASRRENLIPYLDALFLGTDEESSDEDNRFSMHLYCHSDHAEDLNLLQAELEQYPGLNLNVESLDMSEFELLCTSYFHLPRLPINLCQGTYKLANQERGWWQQWRYVAMIAGLGFLLQIGVFIGKGVHYGQQAAHIGAIAVSEYQKVVPNSSRVNVDRLPRIIKGKLNQQAQEGGEAADFLTLLGEAGYHFDKSPDKPQLAFNSLTYNAQRGELVMEMRAQNFEQLDRLKQAIVAAGLQAKISSAVQEDKYFRGRISVSGS